MLPEGNACSTWFNRSSGIQVPQNDTMGGCEGKTRLLHFVARFKPPPSPSFAVLKENTCLEIKVIFYCTFIILYIVIFFSVLAQQLLGTLWVHIKLRRYICLAAICVVWKRITGNSIRIYITWSLVIRYKMILFLKWNKNFDVLVQFGVFPRYALLVIFSSITHSYLNTFYKLFFTGNLF